jgi:FtsP/CotA-like multicopper oxidase with cupredoxin domain
LHLAQFQLVNRQSFKLKHYDEAYASAFPPVPGSEVCTGGVYCPGFGPPLDYRTGNPSALGGNPDIEAYLKGPARPPNAHEAGWKDTVIAFPAEVTRIVVRWAPTHLPTSADAPSLHYAFDPSGGGAGSYVWHCHIVDHEDNEMMRPTHVRPNPLLEVSRPLEKGVDY